jgi:hypothetical protein
LARPRITTPLYPVNQEGAEFVGGVLVEKNGYDSVHMFVVA